MGFLNFLKKTVLANGKAITNSLTKGASLISPKFGRSVSKVINSKLAKQLSQVVQRAVDVAEAVTGGDPQEIFAAVKGTVALGKKLLTKKKKKKFVPKTKAQSDAASRVNIPKDIDRAKKELAMKKAKLVKELSQNGEITIEAESLQEDINVIKKVIADLTKIMGKLNPQPQLPQSQISDLQLKDLQGRAAGGVL